MTADIEWTADIFEHIMVGGGFNLDLKPISRGDAEQLLERRDLRILAEERIYCSYCDGLNIRTEFVVFPYVSVLLRRIMLWETRFGLESRMRHSTRADALDGHKAAAKAVARHPHKLFLRERILRSRDTWGKFCPHPEYRISRRVGGDLLCRDCQKVIGNDGGRLVLPMRGEPDPGET